MVKGMEAVDDYTIIQDNASPAVGRKRADG